MDFFLELFLALLKLFITSQFCTYFFPATEHVECYTMMGCVLALDGTMRVELGLYRFARRLGINCMSPHTLQMRFDVFLPFCLYGVSICQHCVVIESRRFRAPTTTQDDVAITSAQETLESRSFQARLCLMHGHLPQDSSLSENARSI